jgi:RNA polymerase sigma-70 factor (ECF subfamily)
LLTALPVQEKERRDAVSHVQFDTLVAAHHGEIYRYLLLITGRVTDADDLSQETFVQAFKAPGWLGHAPDLRSWLFAIATDLSRRRVRSGKRRPGGPTEARDHATKGGQEQRAVATAITCLPLDQRIPLILRKLHDFDHEGIGRVLGCSSHSSRDHVIQAFRSLARTRSVRAARRSVRAAGTPGAPVTAGPVAPT